MAYLIPAAGQARQASRGAAVAVVAGSVPAGGTGAAAGGWDTANNRNTAITTVTEIKTQLNDLIGSLEDAGVITSS